jgi:NitT/TauT family transport system ATP-binding protein
VVTPEIIVRGLRVVFPRNGEDTLVAIEDVSMTVEPGTLMAVVGESGCGKTTLLRAIAGLIAPTAGRIVIGGEPPLVARARQSLSFMFQSPALLAHHTVRKNVELPNRLGGMNTPINQQFANRLMEAVGLGGFKDALPHQLSGGMKARAQLARALVNRPSVLLMDEPFGALDAMTRTVMHDLFLNGVPDLANGAFPTTVLVTHSIDEAVLLADRVIAVSSRPAQVLVDLNVDIPRPRLLRSKNHPRFLECRTTLEEALFGSRSQSGHGRHSSSVQVSSSRTA